MANIPQGGHRSHWAPGGEPQPRACSSPLYKPLHGRGRLFSRAWSLPSQPDWEMQCGGQQRDFQCTISPIHAEFCPLQVPGGAGAGEAKEERHWYSSAWPLGITLAPTPENQSKINIPGLPYHTSTWEPCSPRRAELELTGKALPGRGDR